MVDPEINVPNVLSFLSQVPIGAGEGRLVYNKLGNGADTLNAWQAAVTTATGLTPSNDGYFVVDASGNITGKIIADPLCGDAVPGCTLVQGSYDIGGRLINGVYTPPVYPVAPVSQRVA